METMGRFPSRPLIRVPFFLLFGFYKGTQQEKGQKATTGAPRVRTKQKTWSLGSKLCGCRVGGLGFAGQADSGSRILG